MKEIFEYDGNIQMICRWAQELLGYQFSVIHHNNRMMFNVDALTRRLVRSSLLVTALLQCYIVEMNVDALLHMNVLVFTQAQLQN